MASEHRINIVGAAGAGTTTLGKGLASKLKCMHFEADDFLWLPTTPPYQEMRSHSEKVQIAYESLAAQKSFVISGSVSSWGSRITELLTHVVYLYVPTEIRLSRLVKRETERFGRIDADFYEWAAQYDEGRLPGRSRAKHESWLSSLDCKVTKLDGVQTVDESLDRITKDLA